MSNKKQILLLGACIVLGALLSRDFKSAGVVFSLVVLGGYLVLHIREAWRNALKFQRTDTLHRIQLICYLATLYLFVRGIVTTEISYFLLLLVLGIDYLVYDKPPRS